MVAARNHGADLAERRWTAAAWLTLGAITLFSLCQLVLFAFAVDQPTDGCLISQGTSETQSVFTCVGDWPTPLRPGDEVLSVSGASLSLDVQTIIPPPAPAGWVVGSEAPYVIRRAGVEMILAVPLQRLDWSDVLELFSADLLNLLTSFVVLLVTAVTFALRPGSAATQLLLLSQGLSVISLILSAPTMLISQTVWTHWSTPLLFGVGVVVSLAYGWLNLPATLLLLLRFPRRVWPLARWPRATIALIFGVAGVASILVVLTGNFLPYLAQNGLYAALVIVTFVAASRSTYRKVTDPVVRAQTGWLGLGFSIYYSQVFIWLATIADPSLGFWFSSEAVPRTAFTLTTNLALPVCLAIAITRYRLFEIDVVVNRVLVYGTLTAALGLTYFGSVVAFQQILSPFFGPQSDLAVIASTLALAALFQPLRRRIQAAIDRRFYRRRYDAARVLAAFSTSLRDQVDLDALAADLVAVVADTVHPTHVSIRLREIASDAIDRRVDRRA